MGIIFKEELDMGLQMDLIELRSVRGARSAQDTFIVTASPSSSYHYIRVRMVRVEQRTNIELSQLSTTRGL